MKAKTLPYPGAGRARKEELDRLWWQEAAEAGEGPAGAARAEPAADEAGLGTWQVLPHPPLPKKVLNPV